MKAHHLFFVAVIAFVLGAIFPQPINYVRGKVGV